MEKSATNDAKTPNYQVKNIEPAEIRRLRQLRLEQYKCFLCTKSASTH